MRPWLLLLTLAAACRSATCPQGTVADCDGRCQPVVQRGDGLCDDGAKGEGATDFACEVHDWDGGDCPTPQTDQPEESDAPCEPGQILDCDGGCALEARLGQGYCDDGTPQEWGVHNFNCRAFGWDRGDCDLPDSADTDTDPVCPEGRVLDCDRNCALVARLGQGYCDEGTPQDWGVHNFNCRTFGWDQGDCDLPDSADTDTDPVCPPGQQLDCDRACAPSGRLGQGYCDDGTPQAWGDYNFNCASFSWDLGDCEAPDTADTDLPLETGLTPDTDTAPIDTDACPPGQVRDCDQACAPEARVGQGYCDRGVPQPWGDFNFDCRAFGWDEGDCALPDSADSDSDPVCPAGQQLDCDGACAPLSRLGQGYCDEGTPRPWGDYNFDCRTFAWDQGDCTLPDSALPPDSDTDTDLPLETDLTPDTAPVDTDACPPGQVRDCDQTCAPEARLGQGYCDRGVPQRWGDFNFDCRAFGWDEGDCALPDSADSDSDPPCPAGQQLDCDGACAPLSRLGQGYCDEGTPRPWGDYNFDCRTFAWDQGDCTLPDSALPPESEPPVDTDLTGETDLTPDTAPVDTDACPPGQVRDCDLACAPEARLGQGYCDRGVPQRWGDFNFDCRAFGWDEGDCALPDSADSDSDPVCPAGQQLDCDGACAPLSRLGQGYCDEGTPRPWGDYNFDCRTFAWDQGDCTLPDSALPPESEPPVDTDLPGETDLTPDTAPIDTDACPPGQIRDCDLACAPEARLGQGYCDRGVPQRWGDFNFDCRAFGWDEGDCALPDSADSDSDPPCPAGQQLDCDGACAPLSRLGQGYCDEGTPRPWGDYNFDCRTFAWDQGDCTLPDSADSDSDPVCPAGQILDCAGACYAVSRLGNGFCDDGTPRPWGSSDFACPRYAWDGGDCAPVETALPVDSALPDTAPIDTAPPLLDTSVPRLDTAPADTDRPPIDPLETGDCPVP